METIARIPELPLLPPPAAVQACMPARHRRPPFPARSVAVLAVAAAVVWGLANWHEQERLARQRRPERLACQPETTTGGSIAP